MNIKPLRDNVVIAPEKKSEKSKTDTGIYLPESSINENEKPQMGKVVAVGESKEINVKKGERVIYSRYSGTEVLVGEETYLIVKNEDILAVLAK
ncbi:MAG TPA: co-chaperone GroES [Candidatus Moranbacteria bacterium]|nr:MAG: co-chaperonin GroES [Candidatus Moranbacteria bacterium GW2011_GWF1_34_10]HBI17233.1 co-chaperone GroES [Candidatus Moranbacteria bacterium]